VITPGWWDELQVERVWSQTKDGRVISGWRWVKPPKVLSEPTYKCADDVSVAGEIDESR
jgi:hypothetical protein